MDAINSKISFSLQVTCDRFTKESSEDEGFSRPFLKGQKARERNIESFFEYKNLSANPTTAQRIIPSVEILLTTEDLSAESHPGYEHGNPMIKPILVGPQAMKLKQNPNALNKINHKRNLNMDYMLPSEVPP